MSADDHRTKQRRNIAENFSRLSRVHEHYRQTDDKQTADDITLKTISALTLFTRLFRLKGYKTLVLCLTHQTEGFYDGLE